VDFRFGRVEAAGASQWFGQAFIVSLDEDERGGETGGVSEVSARRMHDIRRAGIERARGDADRAVMNGNVGRSPDAAKGLAA
jgi:hypothetical protein